METGAGEGNDDAGERWVRGRMVWGEGNRGKTAGKFPCMASNAKPKCSSPRPEAESWFLRGGRGITS